MNKQSKQRLRTGLLLANLVLWGGISITVLLITQPMSQPDVGQPITTIISPDRLRSQVKILSETFAPRDYLNIRNLDHSADYIKSEFGQTGAAVSDQEYNVRGKTYRNVIALLGPKTDQRIFVGAHYDVCQPMSGADDNASGVAGLIELAHVLSTTDLQTQVELVAYTLEEPPFFRSDEMGSAVHAAALRSQGIAVRAMLSLEMIGYFSDAPNSQRFPNPLLKLLYPSRGNFITVVGNFSEIRLVRNVKRIMRSAALLPVHSINAPGWLPGIDFSDHLNYWKQGYPAVMITDTSFYRNENYHTAQDTMDKLDYNRMALVVQAVYTAVLELSRSKQ